MTVLPEFKYVRPISIAEATAALAANEGARPIAGGTDLLPNLRRGLGEPKALVDLSGVSELAEISAVKGALRVGAAVTLAQLAEHPAVLAQNPCVSEAARAVAGPTHRMVATVGGNLCQDTRCIFYNQSDWWRAGNGYCLRYKGDRCHVVVKSDRCYSTYHGDLAPVLMVLAAEAEVVGPQGVRRLPLGELFRENGLEHLVLSSAEFLSAVIIPRADGWVRGYEKVRVRDSIDFPLAAVAAALRRKGDRVAGLRVAVTGTNSAPLMVDVGGLIDKPFDAAAGSALAVAMRKTLNVLRTTVIGPKYRREVVIKAAQRLVGRLWQSATLGP